MLSPEQLEKRLGLLRQTTMGTEPSAASYGVSIDAADIVSAINDNTRAQLAVAEGIALLVEVLAPSTREGEFRVVEREDDES